MKKEIAITYINDEVTKKIKSYFSKKDIEFKQCEFEITLPESRTLKTKLDKLDSKTLIFSLVGDDVNSFSATHTIKLITSEILNRIDEMISSSFYSYGYLTNAISLTCFIDTSFKRYGDYDIPCFSLILYDADDPIFYDSEGGALIIRGKNYDCVVS